MAQLPSAPTTAVKVGSVPSPATPFPLTSIRSRIALPGSPVPVNVGVAEFCAALLVMVGGMGGLVSGVSPLLPPPAPTARPAIARPPRPAPTAFQVLSEAAMIGAASDCAPASLPPYSRNEPSGSAPSGSLLGVIGALPPSSDVEIWQVVAPSGPQAVKKSLISTLRLSGRPPITIELSTRLMVAPAGTCPTSSRMLYWEPGRACTRVRPPPSGMRCVGTPGTMVCNWRATNQPLSSMWTRPRRRCGRRVFPCCVSEPLDRA